jgi:2-keto-4-pentenoate hydratase/2-oxohepta-3-ene-1,7-dioic acid hydratase in catechol pathway
MKNFVLFIIMGLITMNINAQSDKYGRFSKDGFESYGKIENEKVIQLKQAPWFGIETTGNLFNLAELKILYPSEPTKIFGLVKGYKQAWEGKIPPKFVRWFIKPSSSSASDHDDIVLPKAFDEVKVECELVIIIGKEIENAEEAEAEKAIFGFTVGNDIMGFDESFVKESGDSPEYKDPSLSAGLKISDRFAPFGPFIHTNINWDNRNFTLTITNKETKKNIVYKDNTNNLLYSPAKIVSDLSKVIKLNPGDMILTGTSKSFVASQNDIVTVEIDGLGKLTNKIIKK